MDKTNTDYTYATGEPILAGDKVILSVTMETSHEWIEEVKFDCVVEEKNNDWILTHGNCFWWLKDVVSRVKKAEE